jgi:uroporphyrinogen-III decarboxylase
MLFSPGIYEHAAALIGRSPYEVSRDGTLLKDAHQAAWETYRHPLIVVGIDVYNLEPEAYGAVIETPKGNNIPAIARHPCGEVDELLDLPPMEPMDHPRIREVLNAGKALKESCPDAEVRIPVCGPFALGIGLLGMNELLMSLVEDPDTVIAALKHLLTGQVNYLKAIHTAGLRPIFFESGTTPPLLSTKQFQQIEAPLLKNMFSESKRIFNEAPPCVIGGDAAPIARAFLETGPGWVIAPSETDQEAFIKVAEAFPDVHVRINIPATSLLDKTMDRMLEETAKASALAQLRPNTSVGCGVVPYEADRESVLKLQESFSSRWRRTA